MSDTRAAGGTGTPVPVVPPSAGPRLFVVLAVLLGLIGVGFLVGAVYAGGAALTDAVGLAHRSTAVVTDRTLTGSDFYDPRVRGCREDYHFDVAFDDRVGHFSTCVRTDDPVADLDVGDEVEIASVPWSDEVTPDGEPGAFLVWIAILLAGLLLPVLSITWIIRNRRLMRGGLTGELFSGTVRTGRLATTVDLGDRRLVLLATKEMRSLSDGDPAEVWSTRRSWVRRRPAGPWVLRSRGQVGAYTNAWWRTSS